MKLHGCVTCGVSFHPSAPPLSFLRQEFQHFSLQVLVALLLWHLGVPWVCAALRNGSNLFQSCDKSPRLELQQFYSPELQLSQVPYRCVFIFFVNFKAKPVQVWILLLVVGSLKIFLVI